MNKKVLLRKLKALAEKGVGGEKINAQKKLEALMQKNGITEDELDEETAIECLFNISGIRERRLLMQIIYKVLDSKSNIYIRSDHVRNGRRKRWIGCRATVAQKIEIEFLFDFYKRLYKREEEFFFDTFIQKHELFGRLKEGEEPKSLSKEMAMKMVALMKGMSDETPLRQITEQSAASKRQ